MTHGLKGVAVLLGALAFVFASSAVHADMSDVRALEKAKITLVDAIKAAESNKGGQAYEASIDDDSFAPQYEVSVVREGKIYDIQVDALTGKVIDVREDIDD